MLEPAAADAGFKGCAEHQPRRPPLQGRQQHSRVPLLAGAAHLPARPTAAQARVALQRFIQSHGHLGRQGLQTRLVGRGQGLLQPLQPRLTRQTPGPGRRSGPAPAAIGIKAQAGGCWQALQQLLQQLALQTIGANGQLPLEHRSRPQLGLQLLQNLNGG